MLTSSPTSDKVRHILRYKIPRQVRKPIVDASGRGHCEVFFAHRATHFDGRRSVPVTLVYALLAERVPTTKEFRVVQNVATYWTLDDVFNLLPRFREWIHNLVFVLFIGNNTRLQRNQTFYGPTLTDVLSYCDVWPITVFNVHILSHQLDRLQHNIKLHSVHTVYSMRKA